MYIGHRINDLLIKTREEYTVLQKLVCSTMSESALTNPGHHRTLDRYLVEHHQLQCQQTMRKCGCEHSCLRSTSAARRRSPNTTTGGNVAAGSYSNYSMNTASTSNITFNLPPDDIWRSSRRTPELDNYRSINLDDFRSARWSDYPTVSRGD